MTIDDLIRAVLASPSRTATEERLAKALQTARLSLSTLTAVVGESVDAADTSAVWVRSVAIEGLRETP